jgi:adenylate cyclase
VAETLRAHGYDVWLDNQLPAHRAYADVIEEQLNAAKVVIVIWSAAAVKSQWVRAEANVARRAGTLVQLRIDDAPLPLPFSQIECADLSGWSGEPDARGWRKVLDSVAELAGHAPVPETELADPSTAKWGVPSKPSIAVLPFATLSAEPGRDYLADGIVEEITTALSRIRSIFVVAAGSSLSLKGKEVSSAEAAARLGVRYVLEGSVREAAGRVRITVKLIDAINRRQVWADRFEDSASDAFALQDRVALAVAAVIEPRLQHSELERAKGRRTDNLNSYECYLKALSLYRTGERAGVLESLKFLEKAHAIDPDYAVAVSLAAMCLRDIVVNGWSGNPAQDRSRAIELAHLALRIGGDDAEVLAFAGAVLDRFESTNQVNAGIFERALALNPGSATAWLGGGMMHLRNGDPVKAAEYLENSIRLDPLSPARGWQLFGLGAAHFELDQFERAAALHEESVRQVPNPVAYLILVASYGRLGRPENAVQALVRFSALGVGDIRDYLAATPNARLRERCESELARLDDILGPGSRT